MGFFPSNKFNHPFRFSYLLQKRNPSKEARDAKSFQANNGLVGFLNPQDLSGY